MINTENKFEISNFKNIVFLGYSKAFFKMQEINKKLNIKDIIITSSDQKKNFNNEKRIFIFDKFDKNCKNFISDKFKIKETLFISIGCRWIFKENTIKDFFQYNLINFHGTRLPYDAGGGAYSWNILRNDRINNLVAHIIEPGIDKGRIIISEKHIFPPYCKVPIDYENFYISKLIPFYKSFITNLSRGVKFLLKSQLDYLGRYNPRLNSKISGWINWHNDSLKLYRFINAFDEPYLGARTTINNQEVYIKKAHLHSGDTCNHPFMTGLISRHDQKWIVVSTIDENMLLIESILNSRGKNIISKLNPGDRFFTPNNKLELALSKKIIYSSKGIKK